MTIVSLRDEMSAISFIQLYLGINLSPGLLAQQPNRSVVAPFERFSYYVSYLYHWFSTAWKLDFICWEPRLLKWQYNHPHYKMEVNFLYGNEHILMRHLKARKLCLGTFNSKTVQGSCNLHCSVALGNWIVLMAIHTYKSKLQNNNA